MRRSNRSFLLRKCMFLLFVFGTLFGMCFLLKPGTSESLEQFTDRYGMTPLSFSLETGFYEEEIRLELQAAGTLPEGASIVYTLDGTEPDAGSARYEAPIVLRAGEKDTEKEDALRKDTASREEEGRLALIARLEESEEDIAAVLGDVEDIPQADDAGEENAAADDAEGDSGDSGPEAASASGSGTQEQDFSKGAGYDPENPAAGTTVYTVRAKILLGEEATQTQYGVYALGSGVLSGPDEYIVCIDTDPVGLYDYDTGILVGGRNLVEHDFSKYYGNYMKRSSDWQRACHVVVFDGGGNLLENTNAGLAVSGGMSRLLDQKSLNIAAGEPYGEEDGHFLLDVFADSKEGDFAHVGKYTHLRLRARSQIPRTFRETLVGQLAAESGCRIVSQSRPAVVFLNGAFYTLAEMEPTFSNSYLAHRFDLPDTEHIQKIKGKVSSVLRKMEVTDLFTADLTLQENREALEEAVDVDDYLLHFAVNILTNNLDWPRNNVEAWRYTGDPDPDRPYTDGKLRFMTFDSDKAYNPDPSLEESFGTDSFASIMENTKRGFESLFPNVMEAQIYRDRFVTILCDLMNTSFERKHVLSLLTEDYASAREECRAYFSDAYMKLVEEDEKQALKAAAGYNSMVHRDIRTYFGLAEKYHLQLEAAEGVSITWNNRYLSPDSAYSCDYYQGVSVSFTATACPGWRFDHWEINGRPVYGDTDSGNTPAGYTVSGNTVPGDTADGNTAETDAASKDAALADPAPASAISSVLTLDKKSLQDGTCTVRAVCVREEGERLVIAEISSSGKKDWIRLYNAGTTDVDLGAYCISDDPDLLRKYRLPAEVLHPGESCRINGSGNDTDAALCTCSFNLSRNEILSLTPDEETCLPGDSLRIPCMSAGCTYGRKDNGNIFRWSDCRE